LAYRLASLVSRSTDPGKFRCGVGIREWIASCCAGDRMAASVEVGMGRQEALISHIEEAPADGRPKPYGPGSVLCGKYRLDALIGEGAMGAVWQARNLVLDAAVAIKLTHAELDAGFRERLQFEARAAAGLGHPAIVRVFDVAETELGDPFIVMELLHGSTLAKLLKRGRFAAVRAVQVVLPVVDALSSMHARGVVHRDLKPDNLLVSFEDERVQPKILDFGIAKLNTPRTGHDRLEDGDLLIGSPEYMSPEQASASSDVDYATDIWSICVVLYEAVAGETPFRARSTDALLRAIVEDEPASLVGLGVADERLWRVIRVGLSKDRSARHESMSALGRELAAWLLEQGIHEDVCGTALEAKWFGDPENTSAGAAQAGSGVDRDADTLPPWLPDERATRPPRSSTASVAYGSRARRFAVASALAGCVALAVGVAAQKRSPTAIAAETTNAQSAEAPPPAQPAFEAVPAQVASVAVHTTATANGRVVAPKKSAAGAPPTSNRRGEVGNVSSAPLQRSLAKADGTDLGLLAPY
jgi:serine/threonine protein kinase